MTRIIDIETRVRELAALLESARVVFVCKNGVLAGSVTNGDFRRGIAAGVHLDDPVQRVMNSAPIAAQSSDSFERRELLITALPPELRFMPVLDQHGHIVDIVTDEALVRLPNRVVLMAGGLGSRLKSLTASTPKPMLRVGGKPILQTIIEQYRRAGFFRFTISLNYCAEVIRSFFGDGRQFGVEIEYILENERLGTAGSLSLLQDPGSDCFFVTNGDVLAHFNPHDLLRVQRQHSAIATLAVADHEFRIPYGVVEWGGDLVKAIHEKPTQLCQVNAGIYLLDPRCLGLIPKGYFDMPSLFQLLLQSGEPVGCHKLNHYWIDVGDIAELHRAHQNYHELIPKRP